MTQPDINVAVDYALAQSGKEYRAWDPDRWTEDYSDCSSLVIKSLKHAGVPVPDWVRNTVTLYQWAQQIGALVTVAKGVATRGAIMLKGRTWGFGNKGHASMSLGNGQEMAAHGRQTGIGVSNLHAENYNDAIIIPNVNYHIGPPPLTPEQIEKLKELKVKLDAWSARVQKKTLRYNNRGEDVSILIWLLAAKGYLPPNATGDRYGKPVWTAVNAFKKDHGWPRHTPSITGAWAGGPVAIALLK